jgi:hypothetical protein
MTTNRERVIGGLALLFLFVVLPLLGEILGAWLQSVAR